MSTGERLPDVLTQEPRVAQALAPPQTPPPADAQVCLALPALPARWQDAISVLEPQGCRLSSCLLGHTRHGDTSRRPHLSSCCQGLMCWCIPVAPRC